MKNSAAAPSGALEKTRFKDLTKLMLIIFARYLASSTVYVASSQSAPFHHALLCRSTRRVMSSGSQVDRLLRRRCVVPGVPPACLELQPTRLPLQQNASTQRGGYRKSSVSCSHGAMSPYFHSWQCRGQRLRLQNASTQRGGYNIPPARSSGTAHTHRNAYSLLHCAS